MSSKSILSFFIAFGVVGFSMIYSCVNIPWTSPEQERFNMEIERLETDSCAINPDLMGCGDPYYK